MSEKIKQNNNKVFKINPYYSYNNNFPEYENLIDWSALNSEKDFVNFQKEYLHNYKCWNEKKIIQTNLEINSLFLKNIERISEELNKFYNIELPKKFWFNINCEWVHILISYTLQKYYDIEYFLKFFKNKNFQFLKYEIINKENYLYPIDITNALNNNYCDIVITNIILKNVKFQNLKQLKNIKYKINLENKNNNLNNSFNSFYEKIKFFLNKRFQQVYKFNKLQRIIISLILGFYKKNNLLNNNNYFVNLEKADGISNEINIIIEEVLTLFFPEKIKTINFNRLKKERYFKGKYRIIHTDIQSFDRNLKNSFAELKGEKIICAQHGSMYGSYKILSRHNLYEYSKDVFLTWGWTKSESNLTNFLPINLPKPTFRYKETSKENKIFFINSINLSKKNLFVGSNRSFNFFINLRIKKIKLFENLNKISRNLIFFKDHKNNCLFDEQEYFKRKKYILNTVRTNNFEESILKKSNLIILPCYDTVLYESLYFNIPTLLLHNNELFDKYFLNDYELLKKANVVFDNPELLAKKINYFCEDIRNIDTWWNDNKTKILINKFVSRRLKSSNVWFFDNLKKI